MRGLMHVNFVLPETVEPVHDTSGLGIKRTSSSEFETPQPAKKRASITAKPAESESM